MAGRNFGGLEQALGRCRHIGLVLAVPGRIVVFHCLVHVVRCCAESIGRSPPSTGIG